MESQLEWIFLESWGKRPIVERGTSWKGHKAQETRHRGETKAGKDKANVRMNVLIYHLVVKIPGKSITPARHPCFSDHANRLWGVNLEEPVVKKGNREGPPHPEHIREQVRQSRRGRVIKDKKCVHSCDSPGEARKDLLIPTYYKDKRDSQAEPERSGRTAVAVREHQGRRRR